MKLCPICERRFEDDAAVFCPADAAKLVIVPAEAPDHLIGRILGGKYRVTRRIGEGGMGRVYEAQHTTLGRRCAVKVLRPELLTDADAVARFRREAIAAGGIDHPNIVAILDVDQEQDGTTYLVMEYLDGPDMRTVLGRTPVLPLDRCLRIFAQICDAVAAAHARGIVHRDLKPDNVVLVRVGANHDHVKVLDFGISKLTAAGPKLTRTGFALGTPQYMSPEQALGESNVDARTDVYSIGVMLYEALAGRPPIGGSTPTEVIARLLTEDPRPVREFSPGLPSAVEVLVSTAMAKDRSRRFDGCPALAAALAAIGRDSSIVLGATLPSTPSPPRATVPDPTTGPAPSAPTVADAGFQRSTTGRSVGPVLLRSPTPAVPGGMSRRAPWSRTWVVGVALALATVVAGATTVVVLVLRGGEDGGRRGDLQAEPGRTATPEAAPPGPSVSSEMPAVSPGAPVGRGPAAGSSSPAPAAMPLATSPAVQSTSAMAAAAVTVKARASAEMERYEAGKALDGNAGTAWGIRGDPVGEWFEVTMDPPAAVRAVWIQTGFAHVSASGIDLFTANRRLREVLVSATYADGSQRENPHTFSDDPSWQNVPLPGPADALTHSVRLTIRSVYEGSRWTDTHISEIRVETNVPVVAAGPAPVASAITPWEPVAGSSGAATGSDLPVPPCPTGLGDRQAGEQWMQEARRLKDAGDAEGAVRAYQAAIAADPAGALAYGALAYVYLGAGQPQAALGAALQFAGCQPGASTSWMRLADAYVQLGDDARALAAYDRALDVSPTSDAVLLRKGNLQSLLGDRVAAVGTWRIACNAGSASACLRMDYGITVPPGVDWRVGWGTGASLISTAAAASGP
ncbi:MAG: protein kinase [Deltaproteobacteria bacterium]|nr:protein kinase [Deltaproteobacteria bacterium]